MLDAGYAAYQIRAVCARKAGDAHGETKNHCIFNSLIGSTNTADVAYTKSYVAAHPSPRESAT